MSTFHLKATFIYLGGNKVANAKIKVHEQGGIDYDLGNTNNEGLIDQDIRSKHKLKDLRGRETNIDDPTDNPVFTIKITENNSPYRSAENFLFPINDIPIATLWAPPDYGKFHFRSTFKYWENIPINNAHVVVHEQLGGDIDLGNTNNEGLIDHDIRFKRNFGDHPFCTITVTENEGRRRSWTSLNWFMYDAIPDTIDVPWPIRQLHIRSTFKYADTHDNINNAHVVVHEQGGGDFDLGNTNNEGFIDRDVRVRRDVTDNPPYTITIVENEGRRRSWTSINWLLCGAIPDPFIVPWTSGRFQLKATIKFLGGENYGNAQINVREFKTTYNLGITNDNGLVDQLIRYKHDIKDHPLFLITITDNGDNSLSFTPPPIAGDLINGITIIVPWSRGDYIPQRDPFPEHRLPNLEHYQQLYKWSQYEGLESGCVEKLPLNEMVGMETGGPILDHPYVVERAAYESVTRANQLAVIADLNSSGKIKFDNIDEYKTLYSNIPTLNLPFVPTPPADNISILNDDRAFALFRVAGPNPKVITRVENTLPENFSFDYQLLESQHGITVSEAIGQGRLFLCDYHLVDKVKVNEGRFFSAPYALFIANDRGNNSFELNPVAIQIDRHEPGSIFNPASPDGKWDLAKLMVQVADLNHHELKSHLWDCHLAMEPFAIAARRQLAPNHPIGRLLKIHFRYMIFQNHAGRSLLIEPNGPIDTFLGTGRPGMLDILTNSRSEWTFASAGLEADLKARGFNNNRGPNIEYPFAEDAVTVNQVINDHVKRWVRIYYYQDIDVVKDWELQFFRDEIQDPQKGRLGNLPPLQTIADLESFLTQIIFTCTALHSAVNYSQYKYQAFIPNNPPSAWADWHDNPPLTDFLPDCRHGIETVTTSADLTFYRYDKLGDYHEFLRDAQAASALKQFKKDLFNLRGIVDKRNAERVNRNPNELRTMVEYPFLHPDNIANSISI